MKFIVAARIYNEKSQGALLLHKMASTLNELGHQALLIFFTGHGSDLQWHISDKKDYHNPDFIYLHFSDPGQYTEFAKDAVVIYPEIITGNPLRSRYVVRYMLNREGFIKQGVPINPDPTDFILTHSKLYHDHPNMVLFNYVGDPSFHPEGAEVFYKRNLDVTYVGKGAKYSDCYVINGTTEVTRVWPESRADLGNLLRKTRFFYTWDSISATNVDAILCGALPVFMQYLPITGPEVHHMRDFNFDIPVMKYEDTLMDVEPQRLDAIASELASFPSKIKEVNDSWIYGVELFAHRVRRHFRIGI